MTHAAYQMSGPKRPFLRVHQGRQEIQVHASVRNEIGALLSVMIKAFFDIPWGEKKELQFRGNRLRNQRQKKTTIATAAIFSSPPVAMFPFYNSVQNNVLMIFTNSSSFHDVLCNATFSLCIFYLSV